MRPRMQSSRRPTAIFFRHFLVDPKQTGSAIPSSRFLVRRMLRNVDFTTARVIVEFGPGLGCMTREILRRASAFAVVIAFETNGAFAAALRREFPDTRLIIANRSAAEVEAALSEMGLQAADHIVSSLPFANMPAVVRGEILQNARRVLAPGGRVVMFQYRRLLVPQLRQHFAAIRSEYEVRNVPPAHVFTCSRE